MRAGKRQARGREGPRTRLEVQTDGEPIEGRAYELADIRDPHLVTEHELLAENMPSVLRRLRRTDISSNGMLRYLVTKRRQCGTTRSDRVLRLTWQAAPWRVYDVERHPQARFS